MKYFVILIAALGICILGFQRAGMNSGDGDTSKRTRAVTTNWMHDLPSALAQAKQLNKPVLIDFHATWCPPCKMMDRQTFPNSMVVSELENWVPVKVDVDRNRAMAEKFAVRSMPTLVLLNAEGHEIGRKEGFLGPSNLLNFVTTARGVKSTRQEGRVQ